jgi:hypothetical protein
MSRLLKFVTVAVCAAALVGGTWFVTRTYQVGGEPAWPKNIQRRSNVLGMLNVYDSDSKTSLFWYHSDPDVYPVRIEKQDENHWIVTFEKKK